MLAPRLEEESDSRPVPNPVPLGAGLRAILVWMSSLLAEKAPPKDTNIEWEDGEEHEERGLPGD